MSQTSSPQKSAAQEGTASRPQSPKQPWSKPVVVETPCALEINCYAPAQI